MAATVWRGHISFGLISIPVRLFRAARPERVSLRRIYRTDLPAKAFENPPGATGENETEEPEEFQPRPRESQVSHDEQPRAAQFAPVQQAAVRAGTAQALPAAAVQRGYEYEKNRFVVLDPEELKNITPKTATEMEILEFVHLSEIDPVYFETSYYVRPEEAGAKPYALLYKALQTSQLVAVARFAMHNREHIVVLRPGKRGIISHTMYFASEVRGNEEYQADLSAVSSKELELANRLVESLAASFEPEKYHDTYREQLEALIAAKVEGKSITADAKPSRTARVVDITEALQRSLAAVKKPPQSDKQKPGKSNRGAAAAPKTARAGSHK